MEYIYIETRSHVARLTDELDASAQGPSLYSRLWPQSVARLSLLSVTWRSRGNEGVPMQLLGTSFHYKGLMQGFGGHTSALMQMQKT